jgi:ferredoxin-NADP reductase
MIAGGTGITPMLQVHQCSVISYKLVMFEFCGT